MWVEGEPGIGKTALVEAGLGAARELGCAVFWGHSHEMTQPLPLRTLLDGLRVGPGSADPDRADIAELMWGRALVAAQSATPRDVLAAAAERLLVLVDRLCAVSPVVLVGDDLQWADEMSVGLWARLRAAVGQLPLLLVGVCRPVPARRDLVGARGGVGGDGSVLRLGELDAGQVSELVGRLVGAAPGPRLVGRAGLAGGNPLYVRELVDALAREARIDVDAGVAELAGSGGGSGPVSLGAAINARLGFLSEQAVGVLRLAAVLGPRFSVAHLGLLAGRLATDLAGVVAEAVTAGVLVESDGRLGFRHELIRQALMEAMPASLRVALHRQAARSLAEAGAPVEQVAQQLLAAPQLAGDAWAVGWVVEAVPGLTYRAPQIAVDLVERVRPGMDRLDPRLDLLEAHLATALGLLGRNEQVEQVARPVLAGTRDPEVAGRMAWALGFALARRGLDEQLLGLTGQILSERVLPPVWTARMRVLRARALHQVGQYEEAAATGAQARAEAERAGDPYGVGDALNGLAILEIHHHHDVAAAVERIEEALVAAGDRPDTAGLRLTLLANRAEGLDALGRPAEADHAMAETLVLAERVGDPLRLAGARVKAGEIYFLRGRWDDALAEQNAAAEQPLPGEHRLLLRGVVTLIAVYRDDRATSAEQLRDLEDLPLASRPRRVPAEKLRIAGALAAERDGRPDRALARLRAVFDPGATLRFAELNPEFSPLWLPDVVRLALAVGEPAVARAATEACTAAAEQQRLPLVATCARHCRGLLTADPTELHTVADTFAEDGYPFFGAQALENAAVVHAERGDASAARIAYGRAVDTYTELGAAWGLMRADARLRPLGIRRGVRGARRRPSTGWEALTPAESKIVKLVAAGQSNPDIAAALFLSRATVQTHVSHILAKLGAHSQSTSPARLPPRHDHRDPLDWTTRPLSIDMLRRQTACGDANAAATSGLVAYLDDAPVAWVAVSPGRRTQSSVRLGFRGAAGRRTRMTMTSGR